MFPAARALGVHDVHYAMVVILAMGIGLFAPPFGVGFYAACAIGRVAPDEAMGRVWPYLGAVLAALILVALVPVALDRVFVRARDLWGAAALDWGIHRRPMRNQLTEFAPCKIMRWIDWIAVIRHAATGGRPAGREAVRRHCMSRGGASNGARR